MNVEKTEEFPGSIEQGRGVMVTSDNDHMAAGGVGNSGEKAVIELQNLVGRSLAIKDITGYEQGLNPLFVKNSQQPVKEKGKLLVTVLAVEFMAEVPV